MTLGWARRPRAPPPSTPPTFAAVGHPATRPPGIMDAMDTPITDWITIAAYENLPGRLHPMAATRA